MLTPPGSGFAALRATLSAKHPVPIKELVAFDRVAVGPAAAAAVTFMIGPNQLALVDETGNSMLVRMPRPLPRQRSRGGPPRHETAGASPPHRPVFMHAELVATGGRPHTSRLHASRLTPCFSVSSSQVAGGHFIDITNGLGPAVQLPVHVLAGKALITVPQF